MPLSMAHIPSHSPNIEWFGELSRSQVDSNVPNSVHHRQSVGGNARNQGKSPESVE